MRTLWFCQFTISFSKTHPPLFLNYTYTVNDMLSFKIKSKKIGTPVKLEFLGELVYSLDIQCTSLHSRWLPFISKSKLQSVYNTEAPNCARIDGTSQNVASRTPAKSLPNESWKSHARAYFRYDTIWRIWTIVITKLLESGNFHLALTFLI